MGRTAATTLGLAGLAPFLQSCATDAKTGNPSGGAGPSGGPLNAQNLSFVPLEPSNEDALRLANGFSYQIIAKWNDPINANGDTFGTNNDYLAFFPLNEAGSDGILWVNHESLLPLFVSGWVEGKKTKDQVSREQRSVGGSLIRIRRSANGTWTLIPNDPYNRRLDGLTMIPIVSERPIEGKKIAMGTFANCAGGVTPWGTLLTCEENYDHFYGESVWENGVKRREKSRFGWDEFYKDVPPEHYGWVVEVNPLTGKAKKHVALGRFAHESATVRPTKDGRVVVYSGDDAEGRCLYKFISDKPNSLASGTLYVANVEQGRWLPLSYKTEKVLRDAFKDQTEVLIRAREAGLLVGGSKLGRPEDVEIDPATGHVYIALTSHQVSGGKLGSIMKIEEKDGNPESLEFTASTFLAGGPETGFAMPDNLAFDRKGNLWMTTDVSGDKMHKPPFEAYKNNSLFYIPLSGPNAGRAFRVATAPIDAEFTGPTFSPDGRTLFLSVQHPGEESESINALTSHWPDGGDWVPRSSVVAITGEALDKLIEGEGVKPLFTVPVLNG